MTFSRARQNFLILFALSLALVVYHLAGASLFGKLLLPPPASEAALFTQTLAWLNDGVAVWPLSALAWIQAAVVFSLGGLSPAWVYALNFVWLVPALALFAWIMRDLSWLPTLALMALLASSPILGHVLTEFDPALIGATLLATLAFALILPGVWASPTRGLGAGLLLAMTFLAHPAYGLMGAGLTLALSYLRKQDITRAWAVRFWAAAAAGLAWLLLTGVMNPEALRQSLAQEFWRGAIDGSVAFLTYYATGTGMRVALHLWALVIVVIHAPLLRGALRGRYPAYRQGLLLAVFWLLLLTVLPGRSFGMALAYGLFATFFSVWAARFWLEALNDARSERIQSFAPALLPLLAVMGWALQQSPWFLRTKTESADRTAAQQEWGKLDQIARATLAPDGGSLRLAMLPSAQGFQPEQIVFRAAQLAQAERLEKPTLVILPRDMDEASADAAVLGAQLVIAHDALPPPLIARLSAEGWPVETVGAAQIYRQPEEFRYIGILDHMRWREGPHPNEGIDRSFRWGTKPGMKITTYATTAQTWVFNVSVRSLPGDQTATLFFNDQPVKTVALSQAQFTDHRFDLPFQPGWNHVELRFEKYWDDRLGAAFHKMTLAPASP